MRVNAHITIDQLLECYPMADEVLAWHELGLGEITPGTSLGTACRLQDVDIEELMEDLVFSLRYDGFIADVPDDLDFEPTLDDLG